MKRVKVVNSRNIISIGYDNIQHLLEVIFSNGNKYVYEHVPSSVYKSFILSKSKGKYLGKYIVKNYKGIKV